MNYTFDDYEKDAQDVESGCAGIGWKRRADMLRQAAALLRERANSVPDGWKLVPIEPTEQMVRDYVIAVNQHLGNLTERQWSEERKDQAASIHRVAKIGITAMLSVAPSDGGE